MKKHLIIAAILLAAIGLKAQQGEIIYTEFDPPLSIVLNYEHPNPTPRVLELDFDGDGEADHRYYSELEGEFHDWVLFEKSLNGWEIRLIRLDENDNNVTFDENDTLVPVVSYDTLHPYAQIGWRRGPEEAYYYYPSLSSGGIYHETYGMHKEIDGKNYYGWYHGYGTEGREYSGGPYLFKVYIDKMAFCTIPDYPLRYGQTSIIDGVVENDESNSFATIHPNPTNKLFTITVENLRQAEVINAIGQQVLSVQGKGNELSIDMTALPAGVYFVAVTDEEGRKCVRKVVRE